MKDNERWNVDLIAGLTPVDKNELAEFKRAMTEEIIPEIVRVVEERRLDAAKSRLWQLNNWQLICPS